MIRNLEWYNLNEQRCWPLAAQATARDMSGNRLPHNIIADLNIWFPAVVGDFACLGSVSVSRNVATVTILAVSDTFTPLAAATVPAPITPHIHYPLKSLYPGVAGWVVFGRAVTEGKILNFRFDDSEQSILMPQVARRYKGAPVKDIAKFGNLTTLTGIVNLRGGDDIEIVKETREIESVSRDVAVIRLKSKPESGDLTNLYEKYYGPCGQRPESNTCAGAPPIEFINSVPPDCCGNITIEFRGCADVRFSQDDPCSVMIGCNFGMSEACVTPDKLPDEEGKLPNEYNDLCVSESIVSSENIVLSVPGTESYVIWGKEAAKPVFDERLPYVEDFSSKSAKDFETATGKFLIVADNELPLFGGFSVQSTTAGRNLLLLSKGELMVDWTSLYKRATLHLSLRKSPSGTLHNGALVFNYDRASQTGWMIELDHEGTFIGYKGMRLAYINKHVTTTFAAASISNMTLNMQYCVDLTITSAPNNGAWVTAHLTNTEALESPLHVNRTIGPFLVSNYGNDTGIFGFTSYRAITQFNRIIIDNAGVNDASH